MFRNPEICGHFKGRICRNNKEYASQAYFFYMIGNIVERNQTISNRKNLEKIKRE